MNKKILLVGFVLVVIAFGAWRVFGRTDPENPRSDDGDSQQQTGDSSGFDKSRYSIDEPGSIWLIVNKNRPLPDGYEPPELVVPNVPLRLGAGAEQMHVTTEVGQALEVMIADAKQAGIELYLASGYRSYAYQKQLYDGYVAADGQEEADRYSARPGTSEHQTGLAADVGRPDGQCELEVCFGDLVEGKWIADHAHEYGFVIRYQEGKESVTTYQYEPWHLRYVGKELAAELKRTGLTMEEFFDL